MSQATAQISAHQCTKIQSAWNKNRLLWINSDFMPVWLIQGVVNVLCHWSESSLDLTAGLDRWSWAEQSKKITKINSDKTSCVRKEGVWPLKQGKTVQWGDVLMQLKAEIAHSFSKMWMNERTSRLLEIVFFWGGQWGAIHVQFHPLPHQEWFPKLFLSFHQIERFFNFTQSWVQLNTFSAAARAFYPTSNPFQSA